MTLRIRFHCCRIALACFAFCASTLGHAASLTAKLSDQNGAVVEDAIVYVTAVDGKAAPAAAASTRTVMVDQINQTFIPHVRAVAVGWSVNFPNSDNIRHHVYSFSEAKTFELPLYIGQPATPILFDKPGIVTLGCNIHDQMLGYILVLTTPWFAEIRGGNASIANLPAGRWSVEIWHPRLAQEKAIQLTVDASDGKDAMLTNKLELRPERMVRRAPHRGSSHY